VIQYEDFSYYKHAGDVFALGQLHWHEYYMSNELGLTYSPDMQAFRDSYDAGALVGRVGYEDGKLQSVFLGIVSPYLFSKDVNVLQECLWLVTSHRRSYAVLKGLLDQIDDLVKVNGCALVHLSVATKRQKVLDKVLTKRGFTPSETWYTRGK